MRIEDIESELRQVAESLVLADLTYRKGKVAEAEPMYEKALAMLLRTYAEEHPDVDACLLRLGDIYFARDKFAQALSTYSRLHSLRARILSDHHPDTLAVSFKIAKSQEKLNHMDEADRTYEQAIALGEQWLPAGHPLVGSMMESYVILLRKHKNDMPRASEVEQRAKESRKKYKGPGSTSFDLAAQKTKPDLADGDDDGPPITTVLPDRARPPAPEPSSSSHHPLLTSFVVLVVLVVPAFIGIATMMKHKTQPAVKTNAVAPGSNIHNPFEGSSPPAHQVQPIERSRPVITEPVPQKPALPATAGTAESVFKKMDIVRPPSVSAPSPGEVKKRSKHPDKPVAHKKPVTDKRALPVSGVWSDIYRSREKYTQGP